MHVNIPGIEFSEGNYIEFMPSGISSYSKRWDLLENSKTSIHLVTFSFMKDGTTRKLFDLLKRKKESGVQVRVIYDDIVNRTTFVGRWINELKKQGIEICGYNSLMDGWFINSIAGHPFKQLILNAKLKLKQHFHEKYMIVDNKHLIIGGINWGDKYAYGGLKPIAWRDSDVYIRGPLVSNVQAQFLSDFEMQMEWKKQHHSFYQEFVLRYLQTYLDKGNVRQKYPEFFETINTGIEGNTKISYLAHKPYDESRLKLTNVFLQLIKNAKTRLYWGCHGIRPPKIYCEYLADAVKRGVEVVLITNSRKSARTLMVNGLMGWMYWECTKHYKYLLEHGIKIFEWQKPGAFHSKNLVIDNNIVSIGSYNIANGSAFHHSESNILVNDKDFNSKVFEQFQIDLKDCKPVILGEFLLTAPKENAYNRIIQERNKMINHELLTAGIKKDIAEGKYKKFALYEFIDIS